MTSYVADIASYQAGLVPAALRPDCAALIVKCTQGSGYYDPSYATWLTQARAAGLLVAAYHYVDGSAPVSQASQLAGRIVDESLPVMLDVESVGLPQALEVADAMASAHLHPRLLYFSRTYWSANGSPDLAAPLGARGLTLINAAYPTEQAATPGALYPGDDAPEWDPYGGLVPGLWQFTQTGVEAGQRIDISAFRGTPAALADLLNTAIPPAVANGTSTAAAPIALANWPTLAPGAAGPFVVMMQRALMLAGLDPHGADGRYGHDTEAALKAAQHAYGLTVDGVCGPKTWGKLRQRTFAVQHALTACSYGAGGQDGEAGPVTAGQVLAFQTSRSLPRDGIVGPRTSAALGIATP